MENSTDKQPISLDPVDLRSADRALSHSDRRRRIAGTVLKSVAALALVTHPITRNTVKTVANAGYELLTNEDDTLQPVKPGAGNSGIYVIQPGDTATNIAVRVESAVDGVPNNQSVGKLRANIVDQTGRDGLQPGEEVYLPAVVDDNDEMPGVQLPPVGVDADKRMPDVQAPTD